MGEPASGYKWQPFAPGNTAAVKHGANTPAMVRPLADAIAVELVDQAPWLASPVYMGTVAALAWAEARCVLIREWLDDHGLLDADGVPRPATGQLDRLERRAESLRARCGLDPLSMAKLLGAVASLGSEAVADQLEALKAEQRAVVAAWHELSAPQPEQPPDDDDQEVTP
jgi:hypothetical protein